MGKILVIKGADFSANKIETVNIESKYILSDFTRKFFAAPSFSSDVPLTQGNRIRYYIQVPANSLVSINYDVTPDSSKFDYMSIYVFPSEKLCYVAPAANASQVIANPLNGSANAEITNAGWLCISVGSAYSGLYTQQIVDYIESHLNVEVIL